MTAFDPTPEGFAPVINHVANTRKFRRAWVLDALRAAADLAREVAELKDAVAKNAQTIEIMDDNAGQREDITTALETRIAAQDAELAALRPNAAVGDVVAAINRAASELPEGWSISIDLENGAATVRAYDWDGNPVEVESADRSIAEQINETIDAAIGHKPAGEVRA